MPSDDTPLEDSLKAVELTAESLDEARSQAAKVLKVSETELVLTVIEHHRVGFLGLGGDEYKVRATWNPPSTSSGAVSPPASTLATSTPAGAASTVSQVPVAFTCKRGRISLVVTRPDPGQRAALRSDVDRVLSTLPLSAIDTDAIDTQLRTADGSARIVATVSVDKGAMADPISDPVALVITPDHMRAWLVPWEGGPLAEASVRDLLSHAGVCSGTEDAQIVALGGHTPRLPCVIASGTPPVNGRDSAVTYVIAKENTAVRANDDGDRNVDHREVKAFGVPAKSGDVVATKTPIVPAIDGCTVFGIAIPGTPGRDVDLHKLAGKGVQVSEDGLTLIASASGSASWVAEKLCVAPLTNVSGDIDFSTGNVRVEGDLTISGTVGAGFVVEASGNIAISGAIEGATVKAGGNVSVGGGIIGQDVGTIDAEGSVTARFVEGATVRAGGNVVIAAEARLSTILADGSITIGGGRGAGRITGGLTRGRVGVEAVEIGAENGTPTKVQAGWGRTLGDEDQVPVAAPRIVARSGALPGTTLTVAGASARITSPTPGGSWRDVNGTLTFTPSGK